MLILSLLWISRIILLAILFTIISIFGYLHTNRSRFNKYLNNRPFNIGMMALHNGSMYSSAGIPSDPNVFSTPSFFASPAILIGFPILGYSLLILGLIVLSFTVSMRKSIGGEETSQGLIMSGIYSYVRHPINVGFCLISLAIALVLRNLDGLLVIPLIFVANIYEIKLEEKFDMERRFKEEYVKYREKTRIFGPIWLWVVLIIILVSLVAIATY